MIFCYLSGVLNTWAHILKINKHNRFNNNEQFRFQIIEGISSTWKALSVTGVICLILMVIISAM